MVVAATGGKHTNKNAPKNDQPTDAAGPIKKIDACGGHQNWGS